MANRVLIVSGEASSALYAKRLLEEWKSRGLEVDAFGVGSSEMESMGFRCIGRSEEMGVVGFKEVIRHYFDFRKVFDTILESCEKTPPKFALLLDYPGFNLRLAKKLHEMGIKVIYYISPQLWAWKKDRIRDVQKYVDKMLVLFPFEKDFYDEHKVDSSFVGHPILDELRQENLSQESRVEQRSRIGIEDTDTLIGLMPGSRQSELEHHLETQIQAAALLHKNHPSVRFALLVAPGLSIEEVKARLPRFDFPLSVIQDDPLKMVNMTDLVLTASGTATLVVGLLKKPMVVMYKMNSMSAWLAKLIVRGVDRFSMVNIVMNKDVVPEYFQEEATPEKLSGVLSDWIQNPSLPESIEKELGSLHSTLGKQGATERVADQLAEYWS